MSNENAMLTVIAGLRAEIKLLREQLHTKDNMLQFGAAQQQRLAEENHLLRRYPLREPPVMPETSPDRESDADFVTGRSMDDAHHRLRKMADWYADWEPYAALVDPHAMPEERYVLLMRRLRRNERWLSIPA